MQARKGSRSCSCHTARAQQGAGISGHSERITLEILMAMASACPVQKLHYSAWEADEPPPLNDGSHHGHKTAARVFTMPPHQPRLLHSTLRWVIHQQKEKRKPWAPWSSAHPPPYPEHKPLHGLAHTMHADWIRLPGSLN